MDCAFDIVSKKLSPYPRLSQFSPMLSLKSFVNFCCKFRSMSFLGLFLVKSVTLVSRLNFLHVNIYLF